MLTQKMPKKNKKVEDSLDTKMPEASEEYLVKQQIIRRFDDMNIEIKFLWKCNQDNKSRFRLNWRENSVIVKSTFVIADAQTLIECETKENQECLL